MDCDSATDADGISFALYAADRLLAEGGDPAGARDYVVRKANATSAGALIQAYFVRSLLAKINVGDSDLSRRVSSDIRNMEQIAALAQDFHAPLFRMEFPFGARPGASAWLAYGDEPWLITVLTPAPLTSPIVLAVSSQKVAPPGVTLIGRHTPNSMRVG